MHRLATIATAIFLVLSLPTAAQGQATVSIGPRAGLDAGDLEQPFIGADARIDLSNSRLAINPTFDYYLTDAPLTNWSLSTNVLYRFGVANQAFTPYSGAGLGLFRSSVDGAGSSTDLGLNALFGAEFQTGRVRPFLEAQYSPVFTGGSTTSLVSVKGGLLFSL